MGGSLSPLRLNIFTVGNVGVMICLGQGGLRSLSASSFTSFREQERPILTLYDGRCRWDSNLRTCESPALPLCYGR